MKGFKKYFKFSLLLLFPLLLGSRGCESIYNICNGPHSMNYFSYVLGTVQGYGACDGGTVVFYDINEECNYQIQFSAPGDPDLKMFTTINDSILIFVGENGTIIRNTAFQLNYEVINSPTTSYLSSIIAEDEILTATGHDGVIIQSTDTGLTWKLLPSPAPIDIKDVYLDPYDPEHFLQVVGEDLSLYLTFNGGITWQQISLLGPRFNSSSGTLPTLNRIYHLDGLNAYIVGDSGTVIKTTDNFFTFDYINLQTTESLNDIYFISSDSGVIVGNNGLIRFTNDGGTDWFEDPQVTNLFEGKNIKRLSASKNDSVGVFLADSGFTLTVAKDSTYFTDVETEHNYSVRYTLSQNYPNPFNPTTKINYSVPQFGLVTIKVYDLLGEEVATIINEEKNRGNYEIDFNGIGLPSGIYFYKLTAGNFSETKKLVLMK
jgi:photosystem II stability/assembly factor-like uncharacterized protein